MAQASPQPLRPQCSQDWDDRRSVIEQLYWTEDRELPEVMSIMKKTHGFTATPKQYKTVLKRWGLHKNVKTGEMKAMLRIQKRRRAHGKETRFTLRNRPVMAEKIERFLKRHDAQSQSSPLLSAATAPTPADITYSTPAPAASPSPVTEGDITPIATSGGGLEKSGLTPADDWAGLLGSSLQEVRSLYDGMHVVPEPLPDFLEETGMHDFGLGNDHEPSTFAWQTLQHVAQQPSHMPSVGKSGSDTESISDDELYWSDCSDSSSESLERDGQSSSTGIAPRTGNLETEASSVGIRLREAIQSGDEELARAALSTYADAAVGYHGGMDAVHLAAFYGCPDVLDMLHGKSTDLRKPMEGDLVHRRGGQKLRTLKQPTAMHLAVYGNHLACLKALLHFGIDVDEKNGAGETPLMWAIYLGHERIVDLLIEWGACTRSTERFRSALCLAAKHGQDKVIKVLLDRGANVHDCGRDNMTPLRYALVRGYHRTARLLQQHATPMSLST